MPRIKASDITHLKLNAPKESYGKLEDYTQEFDINLGIKPKTKKSSKKDIIDDIKKSIKDIKSIKMPKELKKNKNIPQIFEVASMIANTPKMKKSDMKKTTKEIEDIHKELDKVLKAPKKDLKKLVKADELHIKYHPSEQDQKEYKIDKKIMKQSEGYKHQANNVSDKVMNYVHEFINILDTYKSQAAITKHTSELRKNFFSNAKPSEINDANTLIKEYREGNVKPTKEKVVKPKAIKAPDTSYKGDKKYRPLTLYVKKHRPDIADSEDIHMIVTELIDKKIPRMSVKKLADVLQDLGY